MADPPRDGEDDIETVRDARPETDHDVAPDGIPDDVPDVEAQPEAQPVPAGGDRVGWIRAHPLIVALGAAVVAVVQGWWIWTHRRLGAYDPDEAGYIATALQYQRSIDFLHPYQFVHAVGGTGTGPLVPLLSLVTLIPGPRDPRTVMLVLPLLALLGSIFVAGTTARLAGPVAAIVAGSAWSVLPTVLLATQTYWLGLGTATALAGAMWALVTSDRCDNRRIWLFGFFAGCMLLARTMAIGFVPGLVLAGVIVAGAERRRLMRLAGAFGVALVVAGPWWAVEWTTITDYLLGYGYGTRAGLFGQGGVPERLGLRLSRIVHGVGQPVVVSCLVLAVVAAVMARRRRTVPPAWREGLALAAMFVAGIAALTSTSNTGVWFELPLIAVIVPLGAAIVSSLPRPVAAVPVVPLIGMALVQLPIVWWWIPPSTEGIPWVAPSEIHGAQWEDGFAQYDPRFATDRRSEARRAAEEWWSLNRAVERQLRRISDRDPLTVFTLSGNMEMFNSNTLTLASELDAWGAKIWIPDTTVPPARRRRDLAPRLLDTGGKLVRRCCDGRTTPRVLVIALHDYILFTPDHDVRSFFRQARDEGWRTTHRFDMPGDSAGEVLILEHPAERVDAVTTTDARSLASDPWGATGRRSTDREGRSATPAIPPAGAAAAAAALGTAGPCLALWGQGFVLRAAILALLAAGWEMLLRTRRRTVGWLVLLVIAVVVVVLCRSTMGRAPAILALVGVTIADAALVGWRPTPGWPERRTPVATLAVPLLVAAQVSWARGWGVAVTVGLLAGSWVIVETYHRAPAQAAAVDAAWHRALTTLGRLSARLLVLPIALCLLYLPGVVAARVGSRRVYRRNAGWVERRVGRNAERRDADRPFATTDRSTQRRRVVVGLVVGAVLVGAIVVERRADPPTGGAGTAASGTDAAPDVFQAERDVRFSDLPAYAGVDWADALLKREQDRLTNEHLRPASVGGVDLDDFHGRFTTVEARVRNSIAPPPCAGCPTVRLWLAGGSAAFGLGQRDEHTIASELVRIAASDGVRLDVTNLGVPGWTLVQEAQKVTARLSTSGRRPDVVVFYDGFNDVVGALLARAAGHADPSAPNVLDLGDVRAVSERGIDLSGAGPADDVAKAAVTKYDRVREQVTSALESSGVTPVFVVQPDALASKRQLRAVIDHFPTSAAQVPYAGRVLRAAQRLLDVSAVDLRYVFADEQRPVYADLVHTNERGARIVADALYPHLRSAVHAAAERR